MVWSIPLERLGRFTSNLVDHAPSLKTTTSERTIAPATEQLDFGGASLLFLAESVLTGLRAGLLLSFDTPLLLPGLPSHGAFCCRVGSVVFDCLTVPSAA